jgi:hypothetical protein
MSAKLDALTHGTTGLLLGYLLVFAPLLVGLRRGRAPLMQFVWSPLWESLDFGGHDSGLDLDRFADLHGFLKLASLPDWQRVTLAPPSNSPETRGRRPTAQTASIVAPLPPTSSGANTSLATPSPSSAGPSTSPPKPVATPPSTAPRRAKSTKPARKRPRKSRAPVQVPTGLPPPMTSPIDTQQPAS